MKQRGQLAEVLNPLRAGNPVATFLADPLIKHAMSGRPLSDRDCVKLFLKAVNTERLSASEWVSLALGTEIEARAKGLTLPAGLVATYRAQLAFVVTQRVGERRPARAHNSSSLADRIVLRPIFDATGGVTYRRYAADETAGLDFAHQLLMTKEFIKDLCRCQLPTCGMFFLVKTVSKRKGRSRREYCTPEHYTEFVRSGGAERAEASRAKVPLKEWRVIKANDPQITPKRYKEQTRKAK